MGAMALKNKHDNNMNYGEKNRIIDAIERVFNDRKTYQFKERDVKVLPEPRWADTSSSETPDTGSWCLLEVVVHNDGELDTTMFCATIWSDGWTDDGMGFEKVRKYADDYQVIRWMQLTETPKTKKRK